MKSVYGILLGMSIVALSAGVAWADPSSSSDLEIKIGLYTPYGNGLNPNLPVNQSSFIENSYSFNVGLEYEWVPSKDGLGSAYSVSADYLPVTRGFFSPVPPQPINAFTTTQTAFPILLNYKYFWGGDKSKIYLGAGVGDNVGDYGGFAWNVFYGSELGPNFDMEVRYISMSGGTHIQGSTLNSFYGFDVGWHLR